MYRPFRTCCALVGAAGWWPLLRPALTIALLLGVAHSAWPADFRTLHQLSRGALEQQLSAAAETDRLPLVLAIFRDSIQRGGQDADRWRQQAEQLLATRSGNAAVSAEVLQERAALAAYFRANWCRALLSQGAMEAARQQCEQAAALAEPVSDPIVLAVVEMASGHLMARAGVPDAAMAHLKRALALSRAGGDQVIEGAVVHNMGVQYMVAGLLDQAIEYFSDAQSLIESTASQDAMLRVIQFNLGVAQASLGETEAALDLFAEAIRWTEQGGQWDRALVARTELAKTLLERGEPNRARQVLAESVLGRKGSGTVDTRVKALLTLARIELALENLNQVRDLQSLLMQLASAQTHRQGLLEVRLIQAMMEVQQGQFATGIARMEQLATELEAATDVELFIRLLQALVSAHEAAGAYPEALAVRKQLAEMENLQRAEQVHRQMALLRVASDVDLQQRELALLRAENRARELQLQRRNLTILSTVGAGLALLLLGYFYFSRRSERLVSERLEAEVAERTAELEAELDKRLALVQQQAALEQRVAESDKLRAVGQLTGGIAHDFNNLMTVISCSAEMIKVDARADQEELKHLAEDILAATRSGAEITQGLLAYARRQPLVPVLIELEAFLQKRRTLFQRTLGEGVELVLQTAPCEIRVDQGSLTTALLNLLFNASESMARRGRLRIEVATGTATPEYPGGWVELIVRDTGAGMSREALSRAIEPFYTTKTDGKGTGLGLSMVYGFMTQSGGHLSITSNPGSGTRVTLRFPRAARSRTETPADAAVEEYPVKSVPGQLVLIVEDQPELREINRTALESAGYQVTTAASGSEAIARLDAGPRPDLVLSDIVMPGPVDGNELHQILRSRYPGVKMLLTSGYADSVPPDCPFLAKPYTARALRDRVTELLQGTTSQANGR